MYFKQHHDNQHSSFNVLIYRISIKRNNIQVNVYVINKWIQNYTSILTQVSGINPGIGFRPVYWTKHLTCAYCKSFTQWVDKPEAP